MINNRIFHSKVRISASAMPLASYAIAIGLLSIGLSSCGSPEEATTTQAIAVRLQTLESATLTDSSEYVASLEAKDRVSLAPRIDGRILEIFVSQGDRVERGEPI